MKSFEEFIKAGVFTRQAEMACDMFSHHGLDGRLSSMEHRKMLHARKGSKTLPLLQVFGPLYPRRKPRK